MKPNSVRESSEVRVSCWQRLTMPAGSYWPGTPAGSCSWIYTTNQAGSWWWLVGQGCRYNPRRSQFVPATCSHRHWPRRLCWPAERNTSAVSLFAFSPKSINNTIKLPIDYIKALLLCLCILYHQAVTTGLQSAEADAEQDRRGEGVVVDEAAALGVAVVTVQGQIGLSVAGEEHRAEVDLQGDGLNAAVHADVTLAWRQRGDLTWLFELCVTKEVCTRASHFYHRRIADTLTLMHGSQAKCWLGLKHGKMKSMQFEIFEKNVWKVWWDWPPDSQSTAASLHLLSDIWGVK